MIIFWDIDNTLIDYKNSEKNAIRQILLEREVSFNNEEKILDTWQNVSKLYFKDFLNKKLSFEEQGALRMITFFEAMGEKISYSLASNIFENYRILLENSWMLFDDVLPCLEQLKETRMGIISNGQYRQQEQKLVFTQIDHFFDVRFYAEQSRYAKPNEEFFIEAINKSHEDKENVWYIGDNLDDDIYPCKKLGIKCIWVNRNGTLSNKDILCVNSLSEIFYYIFNKNNTKGLL